MPTVSDFVTLPDGLLVPAPAVLLALELEQRGCRLSLDAGSLLCRSARPPD